MVPTISSHPLMSLLGFVCVPQTDTSSSYLAVDSTLTAVGHFRLLVRWSGIRCLTKSKIRRVVLTVLSSFLRQSCLVFTNVTSALEVFFKCYALYKSTFYLLTYLLYLLQCYHLTQDLSDHEWRSTLPLEPVPNILFYLLWIVDRIVHLSNSNAKIHRIVDNRYRYGQLPCR